LFFFVLGDSLTLSSSCVPHLSIRKYIYTYRQIRTGEKDNGIEPLDAIPIHGYINGIAMGPGGRFCVAAVGQEPRMGRWDRVPRAKNRFAIIRLHDDVDESKK
jgi:hypothetical protein